jgi:hypothetical protein
MAFLDEQGGGTRSLLVTASSAGKPLQPRRASSRSLLRRASFLWFAVMARLAPMCGIATLAVAWAVG